jgi:hypothetical protein
MWNWGRSDDASGVAARSQAATTAAATRQATSIVGILTLRITFTSGNLLGPASLNAGHVVQAECRSVPRVAPASFAIRALRPLVALPRCISAAARRAFHTAAMRDREEMVMK